MIKCLVIDRDGVINHASKDPASPFYYILKPEHLVLKPNVREAFALLNALRQETGLKVCLATKQRCISKGLTTRWSVDWLNDYLQTDLLSFRFDGIYVEESAPDKRALFAAIIGHSGARPEEMMFIDDSSVEIDAFHSVGGCRWSVAEYSDLYVNVCSLFSIS